MDKCKAAEIFAREFAEEIDKLPEQLTPANIRVLADIAAIAQAIRYLDAAETMPTSNDWDDDASDELNDAEAKYRKYKEIGDPLLLDMARDELRHAAYYINRAKVSGDQELKRRLPAYEERYEKLETIIKAPHSGERLPAL